MKVNTIYIVRLILLSFLFGVGQVNAQKKDSINLQMLNTIAGNYSSISVDNLGNVYGLSINKSQIKKMKPNGDSLAMFNDIKQFGNIYSVDVTNPLKVLIYYRDFTTIATLDRFLNMVNKVDLRSSGILQVKAVALSYDNLFWVFDMQEYKLKKVNENGQVLFSSDDFRVLFSNPINPTQIIDRDGSLYLYDPEVGWCIMDYYGSVKGQYPHIGWTNVGVKDGKLYGWKDSGLVLFDPSNFNVFNYNLNIENSTSYKIFANNKIYILNKDGINIFNYQLD